MVTQKSRYALTSGDCFPTLTRGGYKARNGACAGTPTLAIGTARFVAPHVREGTVFPLC